MFRKAIFSFLIVSGAALGLVRSSDAQVRPQGTLDFILGIPQGEFSEYVDNVGFGVNAFGGIGIGRSPIVIGAEAGFLVYGYENRNEPFSSTIPDVTVRVQTSNNIFLGHFLLRLQPQVGRVQPYLDGLFGFKYLFTQTSIENERGGESIAASTNFDDFALSYGAGGGLKIQLYDGPIGKEQKWARMSMNLGIRYLFGGEAEYLQKGSIRRANGDVTYDVDRSQTDLLMPQLGITVQL